MDPEDFWTWLLFGFGALIALVAAYALIMCMFASGTVVYCQINGVMPYAFHLMGHRDWRPDMDMGVYQTSDLAIDAAQKMGCKLNAP